MFIFVLLYVQFILSDYTFKSCLFYTPDPKLFPAESVLQLKAAVYILLNVHLSRM